MPKPSYPFRQLTYRGHTDTLSAWASAAGLPYRLVYDRVIRRGWSAERALETPAESTTREERMARACAAAYASRRILVGGVFDTLPRHCARHGVGYNIVRYRMRRLGLSAAEAMVYVPRSHPSTRLRHPWWASEVSLLRAHLDQPICWLVAKLPRHSESSIRSYRRRLRRQRLEISEHVDQRLTATGG